MPVTASIADARIPLLFELVPRFAELDFARVVELLLPDVEDLFVAPDVFDFEAAFLLAGDDFDFEALFAELDDLLDELFLAVELFAVPPVLLRDEDDLDFELELRDFDSPDFEPADREVEDFVVEAFFVVGLLSSSNLDISKGRTRARLQSICRDLDVLLCNVENKIRAESMHRMGQA
jgi:hypothetical protein